MLAVRRCTTIRDLSRLAKVSLAALVFILLLLFLFNHWYTWHMVRLFHHRRLIQLGERRCSSRRSIRVIFLVLEAAHAQG